MIKRLTIPLLTPLDFLWFCATYALFKDEWWGVLVMIVGLAVLSVLQPTHNPDANAGGK